MSVHVGVSQHAHGQGVWIVEEGVCGQRGMWAVYRPRVTAAEAVGARPTGMHSCLKRKIPLVRFGNGNDPELNMQIMKNSPCL